MSFLRQRQQSWIMCLCNAVIMLHEKVIPSSQVFCDIILITHAESYCSSVSYNTKMQLPCWVRQAPGISFIFPKYSVLIYGPLQVYLSFFDLGFGSFKCIQFKGTLSNDLALLFITDLSTFHFYPLKSEQEWICIFFHISYRFP